MAERRLEHDWFDDVLPRNIEIAPSAFIETTFGMTRFDSRRDPALVMREASGMYSTTQLDVGPDGRVEVGPYTCLNACYIVCNDEVSIGAHCLISWGVVITDTDLGPGISREEHARALESVPEDPRRRMPTFRQPRPVAIEDAVWIGFGAVIMPGVRLGRGCIVGCKAVVDRDVPPLAVVVGNPGQVVRYLEPDASDPAKTAALGEIHATPTGRAS